MLVLHVWAVHALRLVPNRCCNRPVRFIDPPFKGLFPLLRKGSLRSECNILASSVLECGRQPVFYDLFVESRRIFHDFVGGRQGISNKEESTQEKLLTEGGNHTLDTHMHTYTYIYIHISNGSQGLFQTLINT